MKICARKLESNGGFRLLRWPDRRQKDSLYGMLQIAMKRISMIKEMVQTMDEFCRINKLNLSE